MELLVSTRIRFFPKIDFKFANHFFVGETDIPSIISNDFLITLPIPIPDEFPHSFLVPQKVL